VKEHDHRQPSPVPLLPSPASPRLELGLGEEPRRAGSVPRRCPSDGSAGAWHWRGTQKSGRRIISLSKHQHEASCCGDDPFLLPHSQESSFFSSDIIICCHGNQALGKRCSGASWCGRVHLGRCGLGTELRGARLGTAHTAACTGVGSPRVLFS